MLTPNFACGKEITLDKLSPGLSFNLGELIQPTEKITFKNGQLYVEFDKLGGIVVCRLAPCLFLLLDLYFAVTLFSLH